MLSIGTVSPQSRTSSSKHSFRSGDNVQSDTTRSSSPMNKGHSKPNRKVPIIHPSKLKSSIFGDASKMFETLSAVNTKRLASKVLQQQQRQQGRPFPANLVSTTNTQIVARATDTNRNVALQRLQVYHRSCV